MANASPSLSTQVPNQTSDNTSKPLAACVALARLFGVAWQLLMAGASVGQ